MIKKIQLKNFESHEDSSVEFTDGLNLLIGQSNQGKSSIIRGLALVVANQFDKEQVRTGCDFCEITVETDKGYVKAQRGDSVNKWETCKIGEEPKQYKNIGSEVPPETMEILGMGEVMHGDISELPNIMFQHEKHYMLSEVNGKKATANMLARMLDDAIGIGGMEELVKSMADDLVNEKKSFNSIGSEISEIKSQLLDDLIFEEYKKLMSRMTKLGETIESDQKLIVNAGAIGERVKQVLTRKRFLETAVVESQKLRLRFDNLVGKTIRLKTLEKAKTFQNRLEQLEQRQNTARDLLTRFEDTNKLTRRLEMFERLMSLKRRLDEPPVDINPLIQRHQQLKELIEKVKKADDMLTDARTKYKAVKRAKREWAEANNEKTEVEKRLNELKAILKVCPVCGAELK